MSKPVGRPSEGKVRTNLTLSADFIEAARKVTKNLSRFVEETCWKHLKATKRDRKAKESKP